MFGQTDAFQKQFEPHQDGYLIYPWRQGGGKRVTIDEHQVLLADWHKVAGPWGVLKSVLLVVAFSALLVLISDVLNVPALADSILIGYSVATLLIARITWAAAAPWRLVKGRPSIVPPRAAAEAGRAARSAVTWPTIIIALLVSATIFIVQAYATERGPETWFWLIGSMTIFALYLWVAFRKSRDG